ncbi:helix-turn-helix transcriptional regulator [Fictibacillus enclensis]|uniref:helix-turn-helix transcriptional regulator n=1 Tax=Fictibacillus enclensis TaxID=1017270 RepID=UPI0025A146B4|nr:helix-turn-helix transcriptional regulator [Fictibacillus enclensis]MDM5339688.1 helix-turn-helix transcriptional regulator [Fictibacillus enclensis]
MDKNVFKALRLKEGLTQEKMGERLSLSTSTIAAIEAGRRPLSDHVRVKLAQQFKVDKEFLYFFDSYMKMSVKRPILSYQENE